MTHKQILEREVHITKLRAFSGLDREYIESSIKNIKCSLPLICDFYAAFGAFPDKASDLYLCTHGSQFIDFLIRYS